MELPGQSLRVCWENLWTLSGKLPGLAKTLSGNVFGRLSGNLSENLSEMISGMLSNRFEFKTGDEKTNGILVHGRGAA